MSAYVALFRAINVGGHAKVAMSDLRASASALGLSEPRTILQSGNLVFGAEDTSPRALADLVSARVAADLGVRTTVIVRAAEGWRRIIADNPFPEAARADPAHLLVMPLATTPAATAEAALARAITGPERAAIIGDTAYLVYPDGIGRSKLTSALVERHLGAIGTARNWTTVAKIAALLDA